MIHVTGTVAFDTVGVVPRLAGVNTTSRVESLARLPGGAAGNVSAALARLGGAPALVSAVGPDFAGTAYEASLASLGVDLSNLLRVDDAGTSQAFVFGNGAGDQATFFYPGASALLSRAPAPDADIGHFTAGEISDYPRRMEKCRVVSFDPGQEVFHRDPAEIKACIPLTRYLFVNHFELDRLRKSWGWEVADFLRAGVGAVVESRGAEGCRVHSPDAVVDVPAAPAASVADATGAGDAHRAGFLYALSRGVDEVDALRLGAVVAAFAVEGMGPQANLPTLPVALGRFAKVFGEPPARLLDG